MNKDLLTNVPKTITDFFLFLADCKPGEGYSKSNNNCYPCSIGFYSGYSSSSVNVCLACPEKFITREIGASSIKDCVVRMYEKDFIFS